ncbi:hypothetical protein D3C76_1273830 [compost metagenome]
MGTNSHNRTWVSSSFRVLNRATENSVPSSVVHATKLACRDIALLRSSSMASTVMTIIAVPPMPWIGPSSAPASPTDRP